MRTASETHADAARELLSPAPLCRPMNDDVECLNDALPPTMELPRAEEAEKGLSFAADLGPVLSG